jgi:hypothetical protein
VDETELPSTEQDFRQHYALIKSTIAFCPGIEKGVFPKR